MPPRWTWWADREDGPTSPASSLRFIEESDSGTSPKFEVEDEHGVRWKVKLGEEAKSETAATRLLWAAGYVVDEDYYRQGSASWDCHGSPAGRSSSPGKAS